MTPLLLTERHLVAMPVAPTLPAPPLPPEPPSPAVQQIWFAAQQRPWATLALAAADPRDGAHLLGAALVEVGRLTGAGDLELLDARGATLGEVSRLVGTMTQARFRGVRLVVVTDPVVSCPVALPLQRAAEAVLLVLTLGRSRLAAARQTLSLVERERVLGCALLHPGVIP